jgi:excinuclease ABC subunit C
MFGMTKSQLSAFKLPDSPGVYLFKQGRNLLYIGKAASLRDRVRSYFSNDLVRSRGERIAGMVALATKVDWKATGSVLEALILEANLIKQHKPPYNTDLKDNKSWNYVVITKDDFPRVLLVRGRELYQGWDKAAMKYLFGPFPEGGSLKEALKIIRKIFPYRDQCIPCNEQINVIRRTKGKLYPLSLSADELRRKVCRACFNRQIGLCPGVCSGEVSKEEYARTIQHIRQLFSGNFQGLKRQLAKEMKAAAKAEQFEKARQLRRQIEALEHIRDVSLLKERAVSSGGGARIEAFDVAHTSGKETVAVMTVVNSGERVKAAYRKFTIREATNNDVAALAEALERRLNHSEWPLPRVFVIDGGKAQVNAAQRVLKKAGVVIPVVGVVKDERHKPRNLIGERRAIEAYERDILLANAEAHRFAITWHRRRRRRAAGR